MSGKTVLVEISEGVARLTMNRPERRNAFNGPMYDAFSKRLREALDCRDVGAVIVTGAPEGRAFTAGQDLEELANAADLGNEEHGFARMMDTLCEFDKPLLAAVNGVGVGFGLTLLLHCDIVYISTEARLRPPFVTLGVVPEAASSYLLPARIGFQRAAEVLYTADWINAAETVELGIALRQLAPEALLPATHDLARRIARQPPGALRDTKRLLLATRAQQVKEARVREDAVFARRVGSAENIEAIRAFFEKRPADFSGLPAASSRETR